MSVERRHYSPSRAASRQAWPALVAGIIIAIGVGLRWPGLSDPPLDFHATRQYRAAIIARGYTLDLLTGWDEAAKQTARTAAAALPAIEPPVMEYAAALAYRAIGREDLASARALSVLAWSAGGVALAWLVVPALGGTAAFVAVTLWTFLPFTIRASQSFQPDPLMTTLFVFTLAASMSYVRRPTMLRLVVLGAGLCATLLIKAVTVFFVVPGVAAIVLSASVPFATQRLVVAASAIAVVPAAYYYATLQLHTDYGPFVQLLSTSTFWRDWWTMVDRVVSAPAAIAAAAGALLAGGVVRWLLLALGAGYFAFGVVFTHHIHTHDYYSLPLVPIAAVGVAALVERLTRARPRPFAAAVAAAACAVTMVAGVREVMHSRRPERVEALQHEVERYERIGQLVGHSTRVTALDGNYAIPLNYHGRLFAATWLLSGDLAVMGLTGSAPGAAAARLGGSGSDYFVATLQPELEAQPDLKQLLDRRHPVVARDGTPDRWTYVIYDLRKEILSATPRNLSVFTRIGEGAAKETVSLFAPVDAPWSVRLPPGEDVIQVSPLSGSGPAELTVTHGVPLSTPADRAVTVTVESPRGATTFDIRFRAIGEADRPPFGFVDAPPDPFVLGESPVVLQGWALDDTSMKRVWIARVNAAGAAVSLGDATRDGFRPDVAKAFPTGHDLHKAAWAFTLTPDMLKGAARPVRLGIFAEDGGGRRSRIGERTVR